MIDQRLPWMMFATPAIGRVADETEASFHALFAALTRAGHTEGRDWIFHQEPSLGLPLARNLIAARFRALAPRDRPARLFMIDSDVWGFTAADVLRIATSTADVVGAPVPGRLLDGERLLSAIQSGVPVDEKVWRHGTKLLAWFSLTRMRIVDHLAEMDAIGTGFLSFTREAFDKLSASANVLRDVIHLEKDAQGRDCEIRFDDYFSQLITTERRFCGEDLSFCMRYRAAGGTIWGDIHTELRHVGRMSFSAPPLAELLRPPFEPKDFLTTAQAEAITLACPPECVSTAQSVLMGEYELPIDRAKEGESMTVLDLGANIGSFAHYARARYGATEVHCYEPHPKMQAALARNLAPWIVPHEEAIVPAIDPKGLRLYVGRRNACTVSVIPKAGETDADAIEVPQLDAIALPDAEIVKVDIEGREPEILARYLSVPRPRLRGIAVEYHSSADLEQLVSDVLPRAGFEPIGFHPGEVGVLRAMRESELRAARARATPTDAAPAQSIQSAT